MCSSDLGADAPARAGGIGARAAGEAHDEDGRTRDLGRERETPRGREVDGAARVRRLENDGAEGWAAGRIESGAEGIERAAEGDDGEAAGIEAEVDEAWRVGGAGLVGGRLLADPEERQPVPVRRQSGVRGGGAEAHGEGKGERRGALSGGSYHLVQCRPLEPARDEAVEPGAERKDVLRPRVGAFSLTETGDKIEVQLMGHVLPLRQ